MTHACMGLTHRLSTQSHQIWTGTLRDVDQILKVNGMQRYPLPSVSLDLKSLNTQLSNQSDTGSPTRAQLYTAYHDQFEFGQLNAFIDSNQIDLLLIDIELHEYISYVSTLSIPMLLVSQWFSLWQSSANTPLDAKTLPRTLLGRQVQWMIHKATRYLRTTVKNITTQGINRRSYLLRLMKQYHVDINSLQSYTFPLPFTYLDLPVISMTHPDLEIDRHSRAGLTYVYPMVYSDRKQEVSAVFETVFTQVLEQVSSSQKRLILVNYTTMDNKSSNIDNLLSVLQGLTDCISIISLGGAYDRYQSYQSDHVHLYRSIPQLMVLEHADLSIHHGGIHTINECIHYKVPMLVLSGGMYDQNGCALRVQQYGCGIAHFESQISRSQLEASLTDLLTDPVYRRKIEELHASYQDALKASPLETLISQTLRSSDT